MVTGVSVRSNVNERRGNDVAVTPAEAVRPGDPRGYCIRFYG
jgi:hypothetical protein